MVRSIPGKARGNVFVVTQSHANSIAFVDPARGEGAVLAETVVGEAPWAIAVHESSDRAYVTTAEGLAVVDLAARERLALVPYLDQPAEVGYGEYRGGGTGVVVTPDGATVYAAVHRDGKDSTVERFDVAAGAFIASYDIGERPFDVQLSPSGDEVYTIDHDSFTVCSIRLADHEVTRTEVAPFGTEGGHLSHQKLHYAAVSEEGLLYLPIQGKGLVIYDPRTRTHVTETMTGDTHQHGTSLTSDGRLLVVGVGEIGGAKRGPSLTIRDVERGEEVVVPLEKGHENVEEWLDSPDGRAKAVLTGGSTSRGAWDGLTIIDLETHELSEVAVPGRPQMGVFVSQAG